MGVAEYLKRHRLGIAIGSIGWAITGTYIWEEYAKPGSFSGLLGHLYEKMPLHHIAMFLMVPLMMALGYLLENKIELEQELREYANHLEQKVMERTEDLRKKVERIGVMSELSRAIASTVKIDEVQNIAVERIKKLLGCEYATITLDSRIAAEKTILRPNLLDLEKPSPIEKILIEEGMKSEVWPNNTHLTQGEGHRRHYSWEF
jgi:hypothetical protein